MRKTTVSSQGPKTSSASNATASSSVAGLGGQNKKMVAKPIITVTEFTPGTTPQQVLFFTYKLIRKPFRELIMEHNLFSKIPII